jgi:hypothetical protein
MKRDWIDAKYEVVSPTPLKWWQGWRLTFTWRPFLICLIGGGLALAKALAEGMTAGTPH